jgi:hypothetical protein
VATDANGNAFVVRTMEDYLKYALLALIIGGWLVGAMTAASSGSTPTSTATPTGAGAPVVPSPAGPAKRPGKKKRPAEDPVRKANEDEARMNRENAARFKREHPAP